jgi:CBS domain-containing protein
MITDRDIAIRGAGRGYDPCKTALREIMSHEVASCFDDEEVDEVSRRMAELQLRRLPVIDRGNRLVGIVSLGDVARDASPETSGASLRGVSRPTDSHSQRL